MSVTQAVRSLYPSHRILIVGDDDIDAKINVGKQKAMNAAEVNNCLCIFPEFKTQRCDSKGKAFTDFNDLHVSHCFAEIQVQLDALLSKQETIRKHSFFRDLDQ